MNSFKSFDGTRIAYHDEGEGPAVILLHGFAVDGLGQFGHIDRLRPVFEAAAVWFRELTGAEPPMPDPPAEGRPGLIARLHAAGARVVAPDLRGFGASGKSHDPETYAHSGKKGRKGEEKGTQLFVLTTAIGIEYPAGHAEKRTHISWRVRLPCSQPRRGTVAAI